MCGIFDVRALDLRSPRNIVNTVALGILTAWEFAELSADDQVIVERSTRQLIERCSRSWLVRERGRLREELSFFYDV